MFVRREGMIITEDSLKVLYRVYSSSPVAQITLEYKNNKLFINIITYTEIEYNSFTDILSMIRKDFSRLVIVKNLPKEH